MMKERIYIGLLVIALLSIQSMAYEYGTDLLNGDGNFEAGPTGSWYCWADSNEVSSIRSSSGLPFGSGNGAYVWGAGPAYRSSKNFRAVYKINDANGIPVVGNRLYRVYMRYQIGSSTPAYLGVFFNSTVVKIGTLYRSKWVGIGIGYITAADEKLIKLQLAMYSNSGSVTGGGIDAAYVDDVNLCRERTYPMVGGDSTQGQIANGRANSVTFDTIVMPGCATTKAGIDGTLVPTIAFDPDITIAATNATVSNVEWISDNQVSADITPSATGTVTLTFTNVYSNYSCGYTMTSVTAPTTCGDSGTIYLSGDINHDCKVNFLDFAAFGMQWLGVQ
jgi:hypothetical protein